jgi:hypothetical protein
MKKYITAIIIVLIMMSTTQAAVWYVHPDSALNSIQTALNACNTNDIVIVGAGTYYEHIYWPTVQGIRLVSEYGPDTTIIDGGGTGRVVIFNGACDTTTMIMGFKITYGYSNMGSGIYCANYACPKIVGNIIVGNESSDVCAGIHCMNNASPLIVNNVVRNNTTNNGTAGIGTVVSGSPVILQNIVSGNVSGYEVGGIGYGDGANPSVVGNFVSSNMSVIGGGIGARNTDGPISDNVIFNNRTDSLGGGIGIRYCSSLISHNIIVKNTSSLSEGGGIGMDNSSPTIEGCYIADNTGDGIYCENNSTPVIHYCDIIDNDGYAVCNVSTITIDAENNWWGDAKGPYHSTNPGGLGDTVSDYVDFDPWLSGPGIMENVRLVIENQNSTIITPTILNGSTLPFTIHQRCKMSIRLYDIVGRECWAAERATYESGSHKIDLPILSNGIYFIKFTADEQQETRKLLFVR